MRSIALLELKSTRAAIVPEKGAEVTLDRHVDTRFELVEGALNAYVRLQQRSTPAILDVEATFLLVYGLDDILAEKDLEAFTQVNALFNVYPYWRELLSNLAHRMNVQVPTAPLLRI